MDFEGKIFFFPQSLFHPLSNEIQYYSLVQILLTKQKKKGCCHLSLFGVLGI